MPSLPGVCRADTLWRPAPQPLPALPLLPARRLAAARGPRFTLPLADGSSGGLLPAQRGAGGCASVSGLRLGALQPDRRRRPPPDAVAAASRATPAPAGGRHRGGARTRAGAHRLVADPPAGRGGPRLAGGLPPPPAGHGKPGFGQAGETCLVSTPLTVPGSPSGSGQARPCKKEWPIRGAPAARGPRRLARPPSGR